MAQNPNILPHSTRNVYKKLQFGNSTRNSAKMNYYGLFGKQITVVTVLFIVTVTMQEISAASMNTDKSINKSHTSNIENILNTVTGHDNKKVSANHDKPSKAKFSGHSSESDKSHAEDNMIEHDDDSMELGVDYEFVLDLDEQADFDRLLNMLSRSGPAKHEDQEKSKSGKSSTFIDRHDELSRPQSDNSHAEVYKHHYKPHKINSEEEGSHFEDLEEEKVDEEQRRLEKLYFEELQRKRADQTESSYLHGRPNNFAQRSFASCSLLVASLFLTTFYLS